MAEDTPALLDRVIDSSHRSFLAVVQRVKLNVLCPRSPAELIPVDPRICLFRIRFLHNVLSFDRSTFQVE